MKTHGAAPDSSVLPHPLGAAAATRPRRHTLQQLATLGLVGAQPLAHAATAPWQTGAIAGVEAPAADPIRPSPQDPFWFALIGDTGYNRLEVWALDQVLAELATRPLACVVHVGDIKDGSSACAPGLIQSRLKQLNRCAHPLILTPGDNEWTDCHRAARGAGEAPAAVVQASLARLRELAFSRPESLGTRRLALEPQAGWPLLDPADPTLQALPENRRWQMGSLLAITLHVVGSDNGRAPDRIRHSEWRHRQRANLAWLDEAHQQLRADRTLRGLMVCLHADLRIHSGRPGDGWAAIRDALVSLARAWPHPILLLHGDTHIFISDYPWAALGAPNLQRVESFGSPFANAWVEIRWNPAGRPDGRTPAEHPFLVVTRALGQGPHALQPPESMPASSPPAA